MIKGTIAQIFSLAWPDYGQQNLNYSGKQKINTYTPSWSIEDLNTVTLQRRITYVFFANSRKLSAILKPPSSPACARWYVLMWNTWSCVVSWQHSAGRLRRIYRIRQRYAADNECAHKNISPWNFSFDKSFAKPTYLTIVYAGHCLIRSLHNMTQGPRVALRRACKTRTYSHFRDFLDTRHKSATQRNARIVLLRKR